MKTIPRNIQKEQDCRYKKKWAINGLKRPYENMKYANIERPTKSRHCYNS